MNELYTIEDIAKMTKLTSRTIRNYLKDGLLKGRKVGGQWRFTGEDIGNFLDQGRVIDEVKNERRQEVLDFLDGVSVEHIHEIQICSIIDIYRHIQTVEATKKALMSLPDKFANTRFSYVYDVAKGRARFTLFGSPEYICEAMKILEKEQIQ